MTLISISHHQPTKHENRYSNPPIPLKKKGQLTSKKSLENRNFHRNNRFDHRGNVKQTANRYVRSRKPSEQEQRWSSYHRISPPAPRALPWTHASPSPPSPPATPPLPPALFFPSMGNSSFDLALLFLRLSDLFWVVIFYLCISFLIKIQTDQIIKSNNVTLNTLNPF